MAKSVRRMLIDKANKIEENMQDWNFVGSLIEIRLIEEEYRKEYFKELLVKYGRLED